MTSTKDKNQRGLLLGVGYEASLAEQEANTQIQRLKNQIRKSKVDKDASLAAASMGEIDGKHTFERKEVREGTKEAIISERKEKKRAKKLR